MNTAHWHLLLTHLPIIGTIAGTSILIAGFVLKNNSIVKRTALGVLVFSALFAIPSFLTGEGAEEVVEDLPGVAESFIETHEELGETFLIILSILGAISILTFLADWFKHKATAMLYIIVLIASIATSVFTKQLANSGGEIRHTEIRADATGAATPQEAGGEKDDD